jgi:hypothetical protein
VDTLPTVIRRYFLLKTAKEQYEKMRKDKKDTWLERDKYHAPTFDTWSIIKVSPVSTTEKNQALTSNNKLVSCAGLSNTKIAKNTATSILKNRREFLKAGSIDPGFLKGQSLPSRQRETWDVHSFGGRLQGFLV